MHSRKNSFFIVRVLSVSYDITQVMRCQAGSPGLLPFAPPEKTGFSLDPHAGAVFADPDRFFGRPVETVAGDFHAVAVRDLDPPGDERLGGDHFFGPE